MGFDGKTKWRRCSLSRVFKMASPQNLKLLVGSHSVQNSRSIEYHYAYICIYLCVYLNFGTLIGLGSRPQAQVNMSYELKIIQISPSMSDSDSSIT
jgi:hypothetical protein